LGECVFEYGYTYRKQYKRTWIAAVGKVTAARNADTLQCDSTSDDDLNEEDYVMTNNESKTDVESPAVD
jgi:hypothetical protein